jgi:hypothetical protein
MTFADSGRPEPSKKLPRPSQALRPGALAGTHDTLGQSNRAARLDVDGHFFRSGDAGTHLIARRRIILAAQRGPGSLRMRRGAFDSDSRPQLNSD